MLSSWIWIGSSYPRAKQEPKRIEGLGVYRARWQEIHSSFPAWRSRLPPICRWVPNDLLYSEKRYSIDFRSECLEEGEVIHHSYRKFIGPNNKTYHVYRTINDTGFHLNIGEWMRCMVKWLMIFPWFIQRKIKTSQHSWIPSTENL